MPIQRLCQLETVVPVVRAIGVAEGEYVPDALPARCGPIGAEGLCEPLWISVGKIEPDQRPQAGGDEVAQPALDVTRGRVSRAEVGRTGSIMSAGLSRPAQFADPRRVN